MVVIYEERASDSPFVQTIWQTRAECDGSDIVVADSNWDLMLVRRHGKTTLTMWGPTTYAKLVPHRQGDECLGIRFMPGTYMPRLPLPALVDRGLLLPEATQTTFWLGGSAWQFPNYENADTFVDWLVRTELLARDPVVATTLQGLAVEKMLTLRSVQRHFLHATGLTHAAIRQIERAHRAAELLQQGVPILETVHQAGYADQPHLTKSLKRLLGQTPAHLLSTRKL